MFKCLLFFQSPLCIYSHECSFRLQVTSLTTSPLDSIVVLKKHKFSECDAIQIKTSKKQKIVRKNLEITHVDGVKKSKWMLQRVMGIGSIIGSSNLITIRGEMHSAFSVAPKQDKSSIRIYHIDYVFCRKIQLLCFLMLGSAALPRDFMIGS